VPLATPAQFGDMIDAAREGGFAYPAVNVSSSQTLNAALRGFGEAGSDGIVQITTGGAAYAAGAHGDMALGARAIAEYARVVAEGWPVLVALHSDHCPPSALDAFVRPLLGDGRARRSRGQEPLFAGHMFDGSALPLDENLDIAESLLAECAALGVVLEVECGVVGGEEDGVRGELGERLYTTRDDLMRVVDRLGAGERGRYLLAATFGNVHGVYSPEHVRLRPEILREGQRALAERRGEGARFDYVFHGGSGSDPADVAAAVQHGVVKMNVDTDGQYAFTRAVAGHAFRHFDGVLKVDGALGDKRAYDPRAWGRLAEEAMAGVVSDACHLLGSAGRSSGRLHAERQPQNPSRSEVGEPPRQG
jgi:fructose-bisphosphate aldolase, class II